MNIEINIVHKGIIYERTAITGYGEQDNYFYDLKDDWIKITDETNIFIYQDKTLIGAF